MGVPGHQSRPEAKPALEMNGIRPLLARRRLWRTPNGPGTSSATVVPLTARVGNSISSSVVRNLPPSLHPSPTMNHHTSENELNLTTHRAPVSVWDRRGWDGTREQLTLMRWLVGIGGGALAIQGARQRSVAGSILAGLGGTLAWWALTGEGDLSEARRWVAHALERAG